MNALLCAQKVPREDLLQAETGSVLDCLRPVADLAVDEGGARQRELGGSDKQVDEQVDEQDVHQGVDEAVRQGETSPEEGSKRQKQEPSERKGLDRCATGNEYAKKRFRLHACWAKAGHDMLEERTPFVLSVLHKVRYISRNTSGSLGRSISALGC